jgi:YggT family protein
MSGIVTAPLVFLLQVVCEFALLAVLLRFLLQLLRASFFNPLSQFVVRITEPALRPVRRVVPSTRRLDFASVLAAWTIQVLELVLVLWIQGSGGAFLLPALLAIPQVLTLTVNIFLFALVLAAILSWIPVPPSPMTALLHSFTDPLLAPVRRRLPPFSGVDLSPLVVITLLIAVRMLLIGIVEELARGRLA